MKITQDQQKNNDMNSPEVYEIRVAGYLGANWKAHFEGLSMQHEPEGETALSGPLDQAALHGVLVKIRNLGLKLISINNLEYNTRNDIKEK